MIKDYTLDYGIVNLDCGAEDEKICYVGLTINDEKYVRIAKKINAEDCDCVKDYEYHEDNKSCDNDYFYKDGWIIELNVDEDVNISEDTGHELFYIGDDGRVSVAMLEYVEGNEEFIIEVNKFLLKELTYIKTEGVV